MMTVTQKERYTRKRIQISTILSPTGFIVFRLVWIVLGTIANIAIYNSMNVEGSKWVLFILICLVVYYAISMTISRLLKNRIYTY